MRGNLTLMSDLEVPCIIAFSRLSFFILGPRLDYRFIFNGVLTLRMPFNHLHYRMIYVY